MIDAMIGEYSFTAVSNKQNQYFSAKTECKQEFKYSSAEEDPYGRLTEIVVCCREALKIARAVDGTGLEFKQSQVIVTPSDGQTISFVIKNLSNFESFVQELEKLALGDDLSDSNNHCLGVCNPLLTGLYSIHSKKQNRLNSGQKSAPELSSCFAKLRKYFS